MIVTAFVEHEPGRSYGVYFPDFPGCVSGGETMEEALQRAPEALRLHIEGMQADGEAIPDPTPFDKAAQDPANAGAIPFVVEIPVEKSKVVRVNITLEERLLKQIDAYANRIGKSRSAFLADAARVQLPH